MLSRKEIAEKIEKELTEILPALPIQYPNVFLNEEQTQGRWIKLDYNFGDESQDVLGDRLDSIDGVIVCNFMIPLGEGLRSYLLDVDIFLDGLRQKHFEVDEVGIVSISGPEILYDVPGKTRIHSEASFRVVLGVE